MTPETPSTYPYPRIGAAYYPPFGDIDALKKDAEMMVKAGFTAVRLGDLIWDTFEPDSGQIQLDPLVEAVAVLETFGIVSLMATPTAAIPLWLYRACPDVLHLSAAGHRKPYGRRRNACLNHPAYNAFCDRITEAMAQAFRNSRAIIGWQIDNELMAEEPYCYCEHCRSAFAQWLKAKYVTVEAVNKTWNASFWSQKLRSWEDVFLPRKGDNSSTFVDFQTFSSEYTVDFFKRQRDVIKRHIPEARVTHNICSSGFLYQLDLYKIGKAADFISIDNYPYGWTLENEYGNRGPFTFTPHMPGLALSQLRGTTKKPFWVTEAQIGRTCGNQRKMVEPGMVKLWSLQELAHGADGILFFAYRSFPAAHEHVMGCVLDDDLVPRRRYREAAEVSQLARSIRQRTGSLKAPKRVALIRDFECDWAFEDGRFAMDFRYMRSLLAYYRAVRNKGVPADVIHSTEDLTGYSLIIVPSLVALEPSFLNRLQAATESGATILITCMTGLRDRNLHSVGGLVHPMLESLAGIKIEEQFPLIGSETTDVVASDGSSRWKCSLWHDRLLTCGSEALACYESRFLKGEPVITRRKCGKGWVYYAGSILDEAATGWLTAHAIESAGLVAAATPHSEQMDIVEGQGKKGHFLFALNFDDAPQSLSLHREGINAFTGDKCPNMLTVSGKDFALIELL